jgi:Putative phage tail protein
MSGSTIGGIVGGVIGFYFGNPQLGFMIGSAIGGYLDPTVIEGPRLGDGMQQTSQAGVPITEGRGAFPCAGNLIWAATYNGKPLREVKRKKRADKGGPVQTSYSYYRSYAIGICRALRAEDGTWAPITGIAQVRRNGKLVYNTLPGYTIEDQAGAQKFMKRVRFSLGGMSVMPSSRMETFEGVGNVPAYRGLVYMEVNEDDLTDTGGAIPQYEFVVVVHGTVGDPITSNLVTGIYPAFADKKWPMLEIETRYALAGYRGGTGPFVADSVNEIIDEYTDYYGLTQPPSYQIGYSAASGIAPTGYGVWPYKTQPSIVGNTAALLIFNHIAPAIWLDKTGITQLDIPFPGPYQRSDGYVDNEGDVYFVDANGSSSPPSGAQALGSCTNMPQVNGFFPWLMVARALRIQVTRNRVAPYPLGEPVPDSDGYWVLPDGSLVYSPAYTLASGTFKALRAPAITSVFNRQYFTAYPVGPVLASTHPNYNDNAWWTARYNEAVTAGTMPPGLSIGQYPQIIASPIFQADYDIPPQITPNAQTLASVVRWITGGAGIDPAEVDNTGLSGFVEGFAVSRITSGEARITPLQQAYQFDTAEWDGKLRFIPRGGAVAAALGPDDFVETEADPVEETDIQEAELLRRVSVATIDPAAGYKPNPQSAERRPSTIQAEGEQLFSMPLVAGADQTAQIADIMLKTAWAEQRTLKLTIPWARYAGLTPTDVVTITDTRGRTQRARIIRIGDEALQRDIEARIDRQSVYTSSVTGVVPKPPTDPGGGGAAGPTRVEVCNLPAMRETDDEVGLYVPVAGYLPGWTGATVQFSTDGGASWFDVFTTTEAAAIGYTVTALAAGIETTTQPGTLDVWLPEAPESVSLLQKLSYANRAIIGDDDAREVIQFETVTALGSNVYRLAGVIRGTYDTGAIAHPAGVAFVLFDSAVQFVRMPRELIGRWLDYRAVTAGTDPDAAVVRGLSFFAPRSQLEWSVHNIAAVSTGASSLSVSWIGRARLGTDVGPFHSKYFTGYRVVFGDGTTIDTTATTITRTGVTFPVTVKISPINQITGAATYSPLQTITFP